MWNRLSRTADAVTLEICSAYLLGVIGVISRLLLLLALGVLLNAMFEVSPVLPWGNSGISLAIGILVVAQVVFLLISLMRVACMAYRFDLTRRRLHIRYGQEKPYPFLPQTIPFADIRMLRLRVLPRAKSNPARWQLELILQDRRFYPLTAFKDEQKARRIARALQQALGVALDEEHVATAESFRDYKRRFLAQFEGGVAEPAQNEYEADEPGRETT